MGSGKEPRLGSASRCFQALASIQCLLFLCGCTGPQETADRPLGDPSTAQLSGDDEGQVVPSRQEGPAVARGGPTLTFEKAVHDYGEVGVQSKNAGEFKFKNTGTGTLTVEPKVDSTCGCTVAKLAKTGYAPGEEGVLQVTYVAASIPTTATKILTVHSNDRAHPQVQLTLKARVVARVVFEPVQLDLVQKEKVQARTPIRLRSLDGVPFSITALLCSGNCITADIDPSIKATEFTIDPIVDAERVRQQPAGYLKLLLTHPECRDVRIRFRMVPEFQLTPPSLVLFNTKPSQPVRADIWLTNNLGQDFEIASVVSERNLIEVVGRDKVPPNRDKGARCRLTLSVTPPARAGKEESFVDTLSIHLTNGQVHSLKCHGFYQTAAPDDTPGPYPRPVK